jgi:hypothetical protein
MALISDGGSSPQVKRCPSPSILTIPKNKPLNCSIFFWFDYTSSVHISLFKKSDFSKFD